MVAALTTHLQALGLEELTHCLCLCSKILSKVQPPLVSPLSLPPLPGSRAQGHATPATTPTTSTKQDTAGGDGEGQVSLKNKEINDKHIYLIYFLRFHFYGCNTLVCLENCGSLLIPPQRTGAPHWSA